ncbi:hypothetical protein [Flavobacterium cellulosilyticum]|uniref:Tetratricopeptide repeat protein n=1 Tax=Flavobacterium cellulosilyticum TaxID=2541731 RepID=A0A4R5CBN7_9FLAO|nr:hypothetical protein [Flavobacterium cellulosilyticum]TDD97371.1 hypothetical protein E0F76_08645 [Flavobacterium cellulosilyticum]
MKNKHDILHMKASRLIILNFSLLSMFTAKSQTVYYDSINKQKYALVEIHKTYERVIAKGYDSVEMFEYLGNYYYANSDFKKSKQYFDLLFKKYKTSQISSRSKELYSTL